MLVADALCVDLGRHRILTDLDLCVRAGSTTVLLGPNGAGKTTFVRASTGLVAPTAGTLEVCGRAPAAAAAQGRIGLMPQSAGAWSGIRAGELLRHLSSLHRAPLPVAPLVERLGLGAALSTNYRRLSGGQQQAVNLIGAVLGRPELVFLDEPTAGMDPRARRTTWGLITELSAAGVAVLLTTHDMAEAAELADEVVIIDAGRTRLSGTPTELTADGRSLEDVFLATTTPTADSDPRQVA
ncbi:ABC transporter ATP-binding protein [Propionibacteriaceae bacterium Y1685]|uniref:ABC transporter ATP-binding protein n=1 Tax=Microlunatus sp. Y1700 TaxID=3418487 RepID=UPI003B79665D